MSNLEVLVSEPQLDETWIESTISFKSKVRTQPKSTPKESTEMKIPEYGESKRSTEKFKSIDMQDIAADMARRYQGVIMAKRTEVTLVMRWEDTIKSFDSTHYKCVLSAKTFTALSFTNEISIWGLTDAQKKLLVKELNKKFHGIEIERRA